MSKIFGKQTKDRKQAEVYNEFIQLAPPEAQLLAHLETSLASKEYEQVSRELSKLSNKAIFKFWINSAVIKDFCESRKPKANHHLKAWHYFLHTTYMHLGKEFVALDKKSIHTLVQQFVCSYLLAEFKKLQEANTDVLLQESLLEEMCEVDYFYGLIERAKLAVARLSAKKLTDGERTDLLGQFKLDVASLCNVYSDVGHVHAARLYLDIAELFESQDFSGAKTLAKHFFEAAVEAFFAGKYLYERTSEKHKSFTYANGRGNVLDVVFDQSSWDDAEKVVAAHFDKKPAMLEELKSSGEQAVIKMMK